MAEVSENNLLEQLKTATDEMFDFVYNNLKHPIDLDNLLQRRDEFNRILSKFPYDMNNQMNVREAYNLEKMGVGRYFGDWDEELYKDNFLKHNEDEIRQALLHLDDEGNFIYRLVQQLLHNLTGFETALNYKTYDNGDPSTAYYNEVYLNLAFKNIVAVYNIAGERADAGGSKKYRKHAKKSRKHAKKSRKHAKKSRKHAKKSRKHAKKSRKHSKK